MSSSVTYSVTSSGGVITGYEKESVIDAFCSAFGINQDKAEAYIQNQKLIKKNLSEVQAKVYRDKLAQIGLPVTLEKHGVEDEFGGMSLIPTGDEDEGSGPVASGKSGASAEPIKKTSGFSCPKCQLAQDRTKQCIGCGIYIDKFLAANADTGTTGLSDTADAAAVSSVKKRIEADNKAREGEYSFGYLPFALAAALVGMFIWYFIGYKFNRELGFIAIAVGGLIGYCAYWTGSRGHTNGLVCAALLVLAMVGGK